MLALSGSQGTVLYELAANGVLVSLQEIGPADRVISTSTGLLLLLKDGLLEAYQYDGWRFVRLNWQLAGVEKVKLVDFEDEELLLLRRTGDGWSLNRLDEYGGFMKFKARTCGNRV